MQAGGVLYPELPCQKQSGKCVRASVLVCLMSNRTSPFVRRVERTTANFTMFGNAQVCGSKAVSRSVDSGSSG